MKINWTVRIKNKAFWVTAIPALLLLAAQVLQLFGITVDFAGLSNQLLAIVGTVFGLLTLLGVVNDPTTPGVSDSDKALRKAVTGNPVIDGQSDIAVAAIAQSAADKAKDQMQ